MNNHLLVAMCTVAIGLSSVSVLGNANDSNNRNTSKIANLSPATQQQRHDKLETARLKYGTIMGAVVVAGGALAGFFELSEIKTFQQAMEKGLAAIAIIASLAVLHGTPLTDDSSLALVTQ